MEKKWIRNSKVAWASKVANRKVRKATVLTISAGKRKSSAGSSRVDSSNHAVNRDRTSLIPASAKM